MEDGRLDVSKLDDSKWIMDLAFLVDITWELNILNLKLQGPLQLITEAYQSESLLHKTEIVENCLQTTYVISQHADLLWKRAQHSVVMDMVLLLKT